jgi:copper transport protein
VVEVYEQPRRHDRPRSSRIGASAVALLFAALVALLSPGTAHAHTGFESSTPADGSTVGEPVEVLTISFTGEANPVGEEFVALTPAGVIQVPVSVETADQRLFTIRFDPPLAGGQVGIRWNVQAADAHPIEGAFSFTVNAPTPTPTTIPATTVAAAPVDDVSDPPASALPADAAGDAAVPETVSLDEFLTVDNSTPGETTATLGRLVTFLGVALGIGALAFLATAMRGPRREIHNVVTGVRVLGAVIVVGALIEYVGVARIANEALSTGWSTAPGFATTLRVFGGIALAVGIFGTMVRVGRSGADGRPPVAQSLSAAVVEDLQSQTTRRADEPRLRWIPSAGSRLAFVGVGLIIASFWFDGHTVSKGFRPLHAAVNSVHVAAGSVWVGGVVTMAAIVWSRSRSATPTRVAELVVRFSKIATVALLAVIAAGGLMAVFVLDSFSELTGTPWGQTLLLKTAAVGIAALAGAYNHFRLLPELEDDGESPDLLIRLRSTVTAEAIVLVFVVVVTAWLVTAAS